MATMSDPATQAVQDIQSGAQQCILLAYAGDDPDWHRDLLQSVIEAAEAAGLSCMPDHGIVRVKLDDPDGTTKGRIILAPASEAHIRGYRRYLRSHQRYDVRII